MENIINQDPFLKDVLREYKFDYEKLDSQIDIYKSAFLIALRKHLDRKYNSVTP